MNNDLSKGRRFAASGQGSFLPRVYKLLVIFFLTNDFALFPMVHLATNDKHKPHHQLLPVDKTLTIHRFHHSVLH